MTDKHEALIFADDRWTSSGDDLYEWAIDAEDWIRRLHAENETLRMGYAAARREIESLKAQGARQPGTVYAALPDIDEDDGLIWQAIFDWKDCERGAPALAAADRLSRLLADQMRAFADATHAIRVASHGQAPASKIERLTAAQESLGAEFEKVLHDNLFDLYEESAPHGQAPAPAYKDSTPELHIGDSAFESWYSSYNPTHKGDKQRARDAYAAGMGDTLVMAAPAVVAGPNLHAQIMNMPFKQPTMLIEQNPEKAYALGFRDARHVAAELVSAAPTTQPAPQQAPSHTSMHLAEMVLSDCGHSSNYTPLLERVAARIDAHVERILGDAPAPAAVAGPANDDAMPAAQEGK